MVIVILAENISLLIEIHYFSQSRYKHSAPDGEMSCLITTAAFYILNNIFTSY